LERPLAVLLTVGVLLLLAGVAPALINPRFTPIDLAKQSTLIAQIRLTGSDSKGNVTAEVVRTLKGTAPKEKITLLFNPEDPSDHGKAIGNLIAKAGEGPALLFSATDENKQAAAFLHLAGNWIRGEAAGANSYRLNQVEQNGMESMEGTWAGGTDMLILTMDYILTDPSPEVPVAVGCAWAQHKKIGKIEGKVFAAQAVDLAGTGICSLFVAAENGDRIFRFDAKDGDFHDVTPALKLASTSRRAAWGDFNGDGRVDLASWDGKALSLWLQQPDGTFTRTVARLGGEVNGEWLGLTVLDVGTEGKAGLLVSLPAAAALLVPRKDDSFEVLTLARPADKGPAAAGSCLIADFDGDGLPDILQPSGNASVFYKGQGKGRFAAGTRCDVNFGKGQSVAFAGDFAGTGRFDIFSAAADGCRLWHNRGGMKFDETFALTGEMPYSVVSGVRVMAGQTCDINNDGRQDVLLAYAEGTPMLFFNRGFRTFGKALQLTEENVIPETQEGQQAAVVEDFNGDGLQDMAVVLKGGDVLVFSQNDEEGEGRPCARVTLPLGKGFVGPLTVTGWADKRCLGAWSVTAGSAAALFACHEVGQILLKWQMPGGQPEEKKVILENKSIRLELGAGKAGKP